VRLGSCSDQAIRVTSWRTTCFAWELALVVVAGFPLRQIQGCQRAGVAMFRRDPLVPWPRGDLTSSGRRLRPSRRQKPIRPRKLFVCHYRIRWIPSGQLASCPWYEKISFEFVLQARWVSSSLRVVGGRSGAGRDHPRRSTHHVAGECRHPRRHPQSHNHLVQRPNVHPRHGAKSHGKWQHGRHGCPSIRIKQLSCRSSDLHPGGHLQNVI
jgi:hypothetical protein